MAGKNETGPPNSTEATGLSLNDDELIRRVVGAALLELAAMTEFRGRVSEVSVHPAQSGENRGIDLRMEGMDIRIFGKEADGETHLYLEQTKPGQGAVRQDLGQLESITAESIRKLLSGLLSNLTVAD